MNDYLLYNGHFHRDNNPLIGANNRGLRYGDGLFETLKVSRAGIHLMDWHFERLFQGLQLLQFEWPQQFTAVYLARLVEKLCKKNRHMSARVRINLFRGDGGLYDPENHIPHCIIQSWAIPDEGFRLNENGLVAGIYADAKKTMDKFSNCKTNNYLPYAMAALHAKSQQWNEAFLLNTAGAVCDATIANIFIIKKEVVYTCPLEEGCVAGIMRRFLLKNLPVAGFTAHEKKITVADLLDADEVFLTNTIKGIRWVKECGAASYNNQFTQAIFSAMFKK
ncbi:MAG: aminotransferase class IV [Chitinophagaceae bacterium]